MATIDAAKHQINYTGGGTPGARRDTLAGDGPLLLPPAHFFAVVLARSPGGAGSVEFTYREVEFLLGESFILTPAFMAMHQAWALAVNVRCSQLIADADAAGLLDWAMRGSIETIQERLTASLRSLPEAQRRLDVADVTVTAAGQIPDDWWAKVTVRSLVGKDNTSAVLWQFRACAAFALTYTERSAAGGNYDDMIDMDE